MRQIAGAERYLVDQVIKTREQLADDLGVPLAELGNHLKSAMKPAPSRRCLPGKRRYVDTFRIGYRCSDGRFQFVYWRKDFVTRDAMRWAYLGHGSFNMAYRSGPFVYKIPINPLKMTDDPTRLVRVWNEINNAAAFPELAAKLYEDGSLYPFVEGVAPTIDEVKSKVVDIVRKTRRIVVDAFVGGFESAVVEGEDTKQKVWRFANFIKSNGRVICVDPGAALWLDQRLKESQTSLDFWGKLKEKYAGRFQELQRYEALRELSYLLKALLYIEHTDLELNDLDVLLRDSALTAKLANAYDNGMEYIPVDGQYLLSRTAIQQRMFYQGDEEFSYDRKKYFRLNDLFEKGLSDEVARKLARHNDFTYLHYTKLDVFLPAGHLNNLDEADSYLQCDEKSLEKIEKYYDYGLKLPLYQMKLVYEEKVISHEVKGLRKLLRKQPVRTMSSLFYFLMSACQDAEKRVVIFDFYLKNLASLDILKTIILHPDASSLQKIRAIQSSCMTIPVLSQLIRKFREDEFNFDDLIYDELCRAITALEQRSAAELPVVRRPRRTGGFFNFSSNHLDQFVAMPQGVEAQLVKLSSF